MTTRAANRFFRILLAENSAGDVRLTEDALSEGTVMYQLTVVGNGAEAVDCMKSEGNYAGKPPPDLVLLDLDLPQKSGRQVLQEIKWDQRLRQIPVVVLTSSSAEHDVLETYGLHANCFITKPLDLDQFVSVIRAIEHFWLTVVKLPS